jgi:hypothetical protein
MLNFHRLTSCTLLYSSSLLLACSRASAATTTQVKVKVTLRLTVSKSVSLGVEPHLQLMSRYLLLFDSYGLVFLWGVLSDERTGLSFVLLLLLVVTLTYIAAERTWTVNTYHVIAIQPIYWYVGRIYRKHSFLYCCVLNRVYRAVAWQRVDKIRYNIVAYLLKAGTVEAEKQPLLDYGPYTHSRGICHVRYDVTQQQNMCCKRRSLWVRAALVVTQLYGRHIFAAVNQQATIEEAAFSVMPPRGYIMTISCS